MRWSGKRRDTLASRLVVPVVVVGALITVLGAAYLIVDSQRTIDELLASRPSPSRTRSPSSRT